MSNSSRHSPIHDLNEEARALARWRSEGAPPADWPEIDAGLLDDGRGAVPPFPIDLLPQPWRDWVADRARCAGAPVDYVAQALLAAVAGSAVRAWRCASPPTGPSRWCCGRC